MSRRLLLLLFLSPLFLLFAGCPEPGTSIRTSSTSIGEHRLTVETVSEHDWVVAPATPRAVMATAVDDVAAQSEPEYLYEVFEGRAVLIRKGELMIDGRAYGKLPASSDIRITTDDEVMINGSVVAGSPLEHPVTPVPDTGQIVVALAENMLHTDSAWRLYRVLEDEDGGVTLWSPGAEVSIKEGELVVRGKSYGGIEPGQRIDLEAGRVLVDYQQRDAAEE